MNAFSNFLGPLLGLGYEAKNLTFIQISLRAVIIFLATLIMVRLGHKRSLARKSAFDAVLIVILASFLARAVKRHGSPICHDQRRLRCCAAQPSARLDRVSFPFVRHSHQGATGNYRGKWEFSPVYHAAEPRLRT